MTTLYTLDASVFVSACRKREPGHKASLALLERIREEGIPLIEPSILSVEVAAALARTGTASSIAKEFAETISALPRLTIVTLDALMAQRAASLAVEYKLRGADAIYIATAMMYGAQLISLDKEQLLRSPKSVSAIKPR